MSQQIVYQDLSMQYELPFVDDIQGDVSTRKLDADQYMADDLDGVTESVFGSGNIGYASLQAAQTNMILSDTSFSNLGKMDGSSLSNFMGGAAFFGGNENIQVPASSGSKYKIEERAAPTDTDRQTESIQVGSTGNAPDVQSTSSVNSVSASELSSNAGSFSSTGSGLSLRDGLNGGGGKDGGGGHDGRDGTNGSNGNDGQTPTGENCQPECGDTVINLVNVDLGDVVVLVNNIFNNVDNSINLLTITIGNITNNLTEILNTLEIGNLIDLNLITQLVTDLSTTLNQTLSTTLINVGDITNNLTDVVNNVLNITDDSILNSVTDLTQNLFVKIDELTSLDQLGDCLCELGGAVTNLQTVISQVLEVVTSLELLQDTGDNVTKLTDVLNGLNTLNLGITTYIDGAVGPFLETLGIGDGTGNAGGSDGDIVLGGGLEVIDQTLALAGLDAVLDPLEDLVGDIDLSGTLGIDLIGNSETDNAAGDTDITLVTNVEMVDQLITNITGEINLDPVEAITGDIDLNLGGAVNLLGDIAAPLVNDGLGGSGEETLLSGFGDALEDVAGGLLGFGNDGGTDTDLTASTGVGLVDDTLAGLGIDIVLDPVEDVAGDLDIASNLGLDLLGDAETDNAAGDTDITLETNIDLLDNSLSDLGGGINLDPVEAVTGDIDLDLSSAGDVLSDLADPLVNDGSGGSDGDNLLSGVGDTLEDIGQGLLGGLQGDDPGTADLMVDTNIDVIDENLAHTDLDVFLDPVEDVAGDIDSSIGLETGLLDNVLGGAPDTETDNAAGDTDLTIDLDVNLAGNDLLDIQTPEIELDPVENLLGDVDLDINSSVDLLSDIPASGGLLSGNTGLVDTALDWTESTIANDGGLFGDIINGLDCGEDVLPDPVGSVAEGIGALHVEPDTSHGILGGLFG